MTDFSIRYRKGMPAILKDGPQTIAVIKDEAYANLLGAAAKLREQLDAAVFILDNIPGISIDTLQMHRVLAESKVEGV
jgi:hypothetical protein